MTITRPFHQDVRKDAHVDRHVDVQTDGRKAAGKDSGGLPPAGAFVIVLANHKGGVTKTTSTANLGATLAEAGRRVLIVDCDPHYEPLRSVRVGGGAARGEARGPARQPGRRCRSLHPADGASAGRRAGA
jgi:AAA domain